MIFFQQISGNCNTTILHMPDGLSYLYSYDCTLVPGSFHNKKIHSLILTFFYLNSHGIIIKLITLFLCFSDPPEKLQQTCPDCPLLLPVDSDKAVSSAKITLRSYNGQSTLPVQLTVAAVTRVSHQVLYYPHTHTHTDKFWTENVWYSDNKNKNVKEKFISTSNHTCTII